MQKGGWVIDENDEACYIDIDRDEETEADIGHEYSNWSNLPDVLLEDIFSYLSIKDRYYGSLVCRNWYYAFYMPRVWSNFTIDDQTMTRAKFNYYSGWQYVLDHFRTQNCLARIGDCIRGLEFRPQHSFNNLYQFMSLIAWYMEQAHNPKCKDIIPVGGRIRHLTFVFPCNMSTNEDPTGLKLFGTGGQLLAALKRLLVNCVHLKTLKLIDLMLDRHDANHLLDEVLHTSSSAVLQVLHLVNVTSVHCPIMHIGLFFNLQVLVISPQSVDDDILTLLADSKVRHLHLLQNQYTPAACRIAACTAKAWRTVKRDNPALCVHLRIESAPAAGADAAATAEVVVQPEAPVVSIVYRTPKTRISSTTLWRMVDMYAPTLAVYGHEMLPRFHVPKAIEHRADTMLLMMVRKCLRLHTLIIRERISTATLLLIAAEVQGSKRLQHLYVRRNAVVLRLDWPRCPGWTEEFWQWLRQSAKSYDRTEQEVAQRLGMASWRMLSDQKFKHIAVNVRSHKHQEETNTSRCD